MRFWGGEDARQFGVLPANPALGTTPGLTIQTEVELMATTPAAPADGHYELNKSRFRIFKGDPIPEGAQFIPASTPNTVVDMETSNMITALGEERLTLDDDAFAIDTEPEPDIEERAKPAPQNRAKKAAPENRSK